MTPIKTSALLMLALVVMLPLPCRADPCRLDRRAYCPGLRWEAGLAPCLRQYAQALSDPSVFRDECRRYVDRAITRLPAACQAEARVLCPEVQPSYSRLTDCLKPKRDTISAACLAYFPRW